MSTKDGFPRWVVDAGSTPDIVRITVFADFWFWIRGFSNIVSLTQQFNQKMLYVGELL